MRIALFGTSADPPTAGHQAILSWLSQQFVKVVVWASDNPFKSHQATLKHRTAMLQILVDELNVSRNNIFLHPELSSRRTLETLEGAQEYWPDGAFTLVVGSDLVKQLPQWYKIETLLKAVEILVIPRPSYEVSDADLEDLRGLGGRIAIASITGLPVSSSNYRETGDHHGIPLSIQTYIEHQGLYDSN